MSESESSSASSVNDDAFDDYRALRSSDRPAILNKVGLLEKLDEFAFDKSLDWIESQSVTGQAIVGVAADDDLKREFTFYEQALESVAAAEAELRAASGTYIRPDDFFAEMMKTDKHMLRVKAHLLKSKQSIEASEKTKRDRQFKKLGKQVQVEKEKEKAMQKNAQFTAVKKWRDKRKRGEGDEFDLALLDEAARLDGKGKRPRPMPNARRQAKNAKYGSGPVPRGRHFKSNTAESTNSTKGFSQRRNNALFSAPPNKKGAGAPKTRPGKRQRDKSFGKRRSAGK